MPIASSRRAPAEQVLGGQLALQPDPVGVDGDHVGVAVADQFLHGVDRQPVARTGRAAAAAQDLQQPRGGPFGLREHRLGQRAVAGDDVAGDLQLVQGEFDLAAVVEVRLEAGPVLDHQLAQLRQREEAEHVVVGRVEQVALAAADLAYGDGALHPLLPGRARRRRPPSPRRAPARRWGAARRRRRRAAAVRPDSARRRRGPARWARVRTSFQASAPQSSSAPISIGPCEGDRSGRGIAVDCPLVTRVTWGQLQPSRAHPCTAFRSPVQRSRKGTPVRGSRCSRMHRPLLNSRIGRLVPAWIGGVRWFIAMRTRSHAAYGRRSCPAARPCPGDTSVPGPPPVGSDDGDGRTVDQVRPLSGRSGRNPQHPDQKWKSPIYAGLAGTGVSARRHVRRRRHQLRGLLRGRRPDRAVPAARRRFRDGGGAARDRRLRPARLSARA